MADTITGSSRCGIDSIEIARIERLLAQTSAADLRKLFSAQELADSGDGRGRAASLAARFAAKEACLKLFPREAALGQIEPADFSVAVDNYGAPQAVLSSIAQAVLARYRLRGIALSLTHDRTSASAVALAEPAEVPVAHYRRLWRLAGEFLRFPWTSETRKQALVRIENLDTLVAEWRRATASSS
jgi:holo-[acyl-carrier protein] synthase